MASTDTTIENQRQPERHEIHLKGHLDARWAGWFDGFTIALTAGIDGFLLKGGSADDLITAVFD